MCNDFAIIVSVISKPALNFWQQSDFETSVGLFVSFVQDKSEADELLRYIKGEFAGMVYFLALVIGIIAGLRTMTAPTAVSWAASLGYLALEGSWLAFLGARFTPWILSLFALAEFVTDQRPSTPSRKVPVQFGARIVSGALSGAAIGVDGGSLWGGLVAGIVGAVIGTLGGAAARSRLAKAFGRDLPAALIEDAIAIIGAILVVMALR